jgi:hypothetical protein
MLEFAVWDRLGSDGLCGVFGEAGVGAQLVRGSCVAWLGSGGVDFHRTPGITASGTGV